MAERRGRVSVVVFLPVLPWSGGDQGGGCASPKPARGGYVPRRLSNARGARGAEQVKTARLRASTVDKISAHLLTLRAYYVVRL